jgi:hypothetical protein
MPVHFRIRRTRLFFFLGAFSADINYDYEVEIKYREDVQMWECAYAQINDEKTERNPQALLK